MLKTSKEFDFVYKNSYKFRSEVLDICVLRANMAGQFYEKFRRLPCNLVGFSVSKKVGNAVERNLIKRRLRAICREFFGAGNSPLDLHSADLANFGEQQTQSLVVSPKFAKNHESQTENPSVVDSAKSQNLGENNPCEAPENSPASWCKKSDLRLQKCNRRFFARSGESEALPLKAKSGSFWRVGGAGRGVQPFCEKESELSGENSVRVAESSLDSTNLQNLVKNNRANLICIFIAKSQILQTPFVALKDSIFATLKRQLNFRQDSYKKPRTSRHSTQNRAYQNHTKGTL